MSKVKWYTGDIIVSINGNQSLMVGKTNRPSYVVIRRNGEVDESSMVGAIVIRGEYSVSNPLFNKYKDNPKMFFDIFSGQLTFNPNNINLCAESHLEKPQQSGDTLIDAIRDEQTDSGESTGASNSTSRHQEMEIFLHPSDVIQNIQRLVPRERP